MSGTPNLLIYQINLEQDKNGVGFFGYEDTVRLQGTDAIDSSIYDSVYAGWTDTTDPEAIFERFQDPQIDGFRGRSLSISDVIHLIDERENPTFLFCDSIGWKKIDFRWKEAAL